ncbi:hypothetical protein BGZ83_009912 [Gryganskiella cystojenkinii]|nr:hypothetical protein BGZ83_009912 [Gryganskiella cystojenkinii]
MGKRDRKAMTWKETSADTVMSTRAATATLVSTNNTMDTTSDTDNQESTSTRKHDLIDEDKSEEKDDQETTADDVTEGSESKKQKTTATQGDGLTTPQLSKAERKLKKKEFKKLAKLNEGDNGQPSFMLSRSHTKLSLKDLRDLIVYLLTETKTLPWIMIKNKFNIHKVVLLYVEGLDPDLFHVDLSDSASSHPIAWPALATAGPVTELQELKRFFDYMSVIKAGGDKNRVHSATNTLLNVPMSNTEKQKLEREKAVQAGGTKKATAELFMLTLQQLQEYDYPLPTYLSGEESLEKGWIQTAKPTNPVSEEYRPKKKLVAVDCEMVRTTAGSEVTRVTVINDKGETIYDELVMPENPVVDYLTQYSGMTKEQLEGVTTRLEDVQKKLQTMVDYDTILLGHSLENDMKVLKFAHPFIIDTCIVFHHTRGPPFKASLKWLTQRWLGRRIQQGGANGHDSAEDAKACMDLVQLKVQKGAGFGEYNSEQESIFSRLKRNPKSRSSVVIDRDHWDTVEGLTEHLKPGSDAAVVEAIPKALESHNFVWARLRDAEINHGKTPLSASAVSSACPTPVPGSPSSSSSATTPATTTTIDIDPALMAKRGPISDLVPASDDEIRTGIKSVDKSIAQIVESLPPHTALLVTSGHGDLRPVINLQQRQRHFQKLYNTLNLSAIPEEDHFLEKDHEALSEAVEKAKNGVCFFMVK